MTEASTLRLGQVAALTRINLEDFVSAVGWQDRSVPAVVARFLLWLPARRFARQMAHFDALTASQGLGDAARSTLRHYVRDVQVFGAERVPNGPFLALSNHPGMMDTLALFACLNRPDLKVLAAHRPFLLALPSVAAHLLYLDGDSASNIPAIRGAVEHLRDGHPLLTFPAGRIEPDPDIYGGAVEALATWTDSAGIFVRTVPDFVIVPILVRGVVWGRAAHNPIAASRPNPDAQGRMAAAIQSLVQFSLGLRPVTVRVHIGRPISKASLASDRGAGAREAILAEMTRMIRDMPSAGGRSVL